MRGAAARQGRRISGPIAQPHVRPWSTVFRARAKGGALFLKCCGPSQAYEPRLTALLARAVPSAVPTLVARHPREDWMLLVDGGRALRETVVVEDLPREWERILPRYAEMQIALLGRLRELLASGTPDHRLERLAGLVEELLRYDAAHRRRRDRLTPEQRRGIRESLPAVRARCEELAALGIGPSIDHDDLHDWNVLRHGRRTVIFDWGDACVTHPFVSLTIPLRFLAERLRTSERDIRVLRLRDAYLEPFDRSAPPAALRRGSAIARRLGIVTRAMAWHRVLTLSGGAEDVGSESLAAWLRLLPHAFPAGG